MRLRTICASALSLLLANLPSVAQVRDIDPAKLPQTPAVQSAYRTAQDLEPYANAWTLHWNYDIPESQVQDKLADAVGILSEALAADPNNHDLQLLTGLVAHFAYNVNDEAAFKIATDNLTKAAAADPADIRGPWFLGIHQCQSLQVVEGMNRLLKVEADFKDPPVDFWNDYVTCATVAVLPAHTLRAIDRAVADGQPRESFKTLTGIANTRYKTADPSKTIAAHDAWTDTLLPESRARFTSHLCGLSFVVDARSDVNVADITGGTCVFAASPPALKGQPAPTFFLMAKSPAAGQSLEDFVRSYLKANDVFKDSSTHVNPAVDLPCPVNSCLSLDVVAPSIYWKQGGAHLLIVAFARDQPLYDGLPFESPEGPALSPPKGQKGPVAFRIDPTFRRIPGTLYYMVLMDSNQQIFATSKPGFDAFLKSLVAE